MNFRYLSTLCLLWTATLGLLGCGGGGSPAGESGPPPVVSAGVYTGSVNQRSFVGILTADRRLYGVHDAPINDLYSGAVAGLGTTRAEASTVQLFRNTSANLASVNASFTPPTDGTVNVRMSQPDANLDLNFQTSRSVLQTASLSNVASSWTGKLSYGLGSNLSFSVNINSAGDISASSGFGNSTACQFRVGSKVSTTNLTPNVFDLTLVVANVTSCTLFSDQTLTGVAFVVHNPAPGVTQRLYWVATAPSGIGISFKADR